MPWTEYKISDIIWHSDEHTSSTYYWNNRSDNWNTTSLNWDTTSFGTTKYTFEQGRNIPVWTEV